MCNVESYIERVLVLIDEGARYLILSHSLVDKVWCQVSFEVPVLIVALSKGRIEPDRVVSGSYDEMISNDDPFIREWDLKSNEEDSNIDAVKHLVTMIKRLSTKDSSNEQ